MTRKYHGKNNLAAIKPENLEERLITIQVAPEDINFVLKILETHSHLAIPVQLEPAKGLIGFHTTRGQQELLFNILASLPRQVTIF